MVEAGDFTELEKAVLRERFLKALGIKDFQTAEEIAVRVGWVGKGGKIDMKLARGPWKGKSK